MFYRTDTNDHGLAHNPFKAIVAPRPIGWISTIDGEGRANLAPYSFFNGLHDDPPMVMFSSTGLRDGVVKDSLRNIRETNEFCVNIVPYALRDAMNTTSAPNAYGIDEFEQAGLEKAQSRVIAAPHVKRSPAVLECTLFQEVPLLNEATMVIGLVVGVHINDAFISDGMLDVTVYQPLARLGYKDYACVSEVFALTRPE